MITLQVTSDSSVPELRVAERTIADLIKLAIGKDMEKPTLSEIAEYFKVPPVSEFVGTSVIFNATELAEAETMGKSVCSTVDASQSTTAPGDIQVNTSLPEPTSVFGQAAQTAANVANHAVPLSELHAHDVDGIKWDKRIHSSSKELNKDGTWRKRRGVADELVRQIEAELRGVKPPLLTETLVTTAVSVDHPTVGASVPSSVMSFTELLDGVTKAMVAGQLSQATIAEALKSVGLEALPHLLGKPELIPAFREALGGIV